MLVQLLEDKRSSHRPLRTSRKNCPVRQSGAVVAETLLFFYTGCKKREIVEMWGNQAEQKKVELQFVHYEINHEMLPFQIFLQQCGEDAVYMLGCRLQKREGIRRIIASRQSPRGGVQPRHQTLIRARVSSRYSPPGAKLHLPH
ncbi:hypothetical protein JOQ06_003070 [Pogonophryne albipinna]|uniref:Uncharacterized protein n=1 Tax=Pogonophryne albipinna TaxID=1090488 RepID=A0AAD6B5L4_9TELE|nr:hypothetical protein JOQ06_003070 [Pogonophryne albipinna]